MAFSVEGVRNSLNLFECMVPKRGFEPPHRCRY
jgi:hypothetical protein